MRQTELQLRTDDRFVTDVTALVQDFASRGADGLLNVFVPHATAGVALMETGSGSEHDLEEALQRLLPRDERYTHQHGSRGHGATHLLPVLVSPSLTIPVRAGRLQLGTWQSIVIVDPNQDNPQRSVHLSMLEG
jgi:secondary thiamine-phosphate synthase enzyme